MGNVNELQEREDKSVDDTDSSNSEQDTSSSSDSIVSLEHSLILPSDCLAAQPNDETTTIDSAPPLQQIDTSVGEFANSQVHKDIEISIGDTCDDSFPLSESAIPASFDILEDLSPVPSDISDAFLTPDIEGTNELNSPLNSFGPWPEQNHGQQTQNKSDAETMDHETLPEPAKIAHNISGTEETDYTNDIRSDSIAHLLQDPGLEDESSGLVLVESHQIPLALVHNTSECKKNTDDELDEHESKGRPSGLLASDELLLPLSTETPSPVTLASEDVPSELSTEPSVGVPVPENVLPKCELEDISNSLACLDAEERLAVPLVAPIEPSEDDSTSLSIKILLEMPSESESQEQFFTTTEYYDLTRYRNDPTPEDNASNASDNTSATPVEFVSHEDIPSDVPKHPSAMSVESVAIQNGPLDAPEHPSVMRVESIDLEDKISNTPENTSVMPVDLGHLQHVPSASLETTSSAPVETATVSILVTSLGDMHLTAPENDASAMPMELTTVSTSMISVRTYATDDTSVTPVESTTVSTTSTTSASLADTPSSAPEYTSGLLVEPERDAQVATPGSIEVPSPRHTADKPNWALAPDSPPKPTVESPKKRRRRAPRRGKQANSESGTGTQDAMPQSFKEEWVDTSRVKPKAEQAHHKSSETLARSASSNEGTSRRKKSHLQAATSPVVANVVTPGKNDGVIPHLPPTADQADSIASHGVFTIVSEPTAQPDETPGIDIPALPDPIFKQKVPSLGQVQLKNIAGHVNKSSTNPSTIKDEARNLSSRSFKHGHPAEDKRECLSFGSLAVTNSGNNTTKGQPSPISNPSKEASDRDHVGPFQSSILAAAQESNHNLAKYPPSGKNTGILPIITENQLVRGGKVNKGKYGQTSPPRGIQLNVNNAEDSKNKTRLHSEECRADSQRPSENPIAKIPTSSSAVEPRAPRPPKRLSLPVVEEELRYGSTGQPLLLRGSEVARSVVSNSPIPRTVRSSKREEKNSTSTPHFAPVGTAGAFTAATRTQYGPFHEHLAVGGENPTARVNLPPKRPNSLGSEQFYEDNRHGRRSPFQSGIPVSTKKYAPKDLAINPAPGPLLLHHTMCGLEFGLGDRASPEISGPGSSSQNTHRTSDVTHISHSTAQPYPRRPIIDTIGRTRSALALNQNQFSNPEHRTSRLLESTPPSHTYGTNIGTSAPIYVFPTGISQRQGLMHHHQHNAAYRTQHGQRQLGNLQSGNLTTMGQPQNASFPTEFVHRTPTQRAPLRRHLPDSFHRLPEHSNYSSAENQR